MRNPTVNPVPFRPRTDIERRLLELVEADSGEWVIEMVTQAEYNESWDPLDGEANWPGEDAQYWIRTACLHNGLLIGGRIYLGHVRGEAMEIKFSARRF